MTFTAFIVLTLVALGLEAAVGYPDRVYRAIGHPVTWMGRVITRLDRRMNHEEDDPEARRAAGRKALLILLGLTALVSVCLQIVLSDVVGGFLVLAFLASTLPAQRSLYEHVRDVADGLDEGGLDGGRHAVSMIVGRNPHVLDEAGICRAAIESLAENFSDGVVAPAFWMALAGLPGAALYKAVNTADSMIGHRTARHADFGRAAARLDDWVNLPASRLAALWIVLATLVRRRRTTWPAIRAVLRDARKHRSPNAGWPEAAMAGALGLSLAGPRVYGDTLVEDATMGDGRRDATSEDIRRALRLYRRACMVQYGALILLLVLVSR